MNIGHLYLWSKLYTSANAMTSLHGDADSRLQSIAHPRWTDLRKWQQLQTSKQTTTMRLAWRARARAWEEERCTLGSPPGGVRVHTPSMACYWVCDGWGRPCHNSHVTHTQTDRHACIAEEFKFKNLTNAIRAKMKQWLWLGLGGGT